jgi:hypothetical protein
LSYHLYCALRRPGKSQPRIPPGIGGQAVYLVSQDGLSVAVSRDGQPEDSSDLASLRAHAQVVAAWNRFQTVIPLRYGCRLAREDQITVRLRESAPHYEALLTELDGCVEMGLRLLVPKRPGSAAAPGEPEGPTDGAEPRAGLAYLKARQTYYDGLENWGLEHRQLAQELAGIFAGLVRRVKTEGPAPRLPMLSLYLLVPRDAVQEVRQRFRRFNRQTEYGLLLSGPWPPYNFVVDEAENPLAELATPPFQAKLPSTGWF